MLSRNLLVVEQNQSNFTIIEKLVRKLAKSILRTLEEHLETLSQCLQYFEQAVKILGHLLANIYLFKVNNRNTIKRCEISSKLTIKTPERRRRSGVFTVNFEHISHLFLVFLLTLNKQCQLYCVLTSTSCFYVVFIRRLPGDFLCTCKSCFRANLNC